MLEPLLEKSGRVKVFARQEAANHASVWDCALDVMELLIARGVRVSLARRVLRVVAELLDNVLHYQPCVRKKGCERYTIEVWQADRGAVDVEISNFVLERDVAELSKKLECVKGYTVGEAKRLMQKALRLGVNPSVSGAGIGLLTVRQWVERLDWRFEPGEGGCARFVIGLRVL